MRPIHGINSVRPNENVRYMDHLLKDMCSFHHSYAKRLLFGSNSKVIFIGIYYLKRTRLIMSKASSILATSKILLRKCISNCKSAAKVI